MSTDPAHKKDMALCRDWLVSYMKTCGLDAEVWETSGHEVVFGQRLCGEGPTILFYGHYDVQPAEPLDEWVSPPFEPEVRDHVVYSRGAIDNKGQGFYTLLGVKAFLELAGKKKINIKVLLEGEEEIGSPGLAEIAEKKREELKADHVFIVDLDMAGEKKPAVTLGIRGVASLNVVVTNAASDLHSGIFGGIALNPARLLAEVLGKMWDDNGKVTVPHFYDGMKTFSKEELAILDWDVDVKKNADSYEVKVLQGEGDYSFLESNWIRPTLEINGMKSGYTGEGFKTIIPAKASVKLSCRLVPGQDPEKVIDSLGAFLKKNLPEGIGLSLEKGHGSPGIMTSPKSKTIDGAVKAYERVYQTKCRRQLCGATIPIVPLLSKVCGGELVMIGVGFSTDNMHAPNECFGLDRFKEGFLSITQLLEIFSSGVG
ncbi:MAG: M20/M25/M40 family metallo-hydrolase [Chlamydiia bacterium]|nr:M20/M25/M40 family metallo-hydrolase [Chlamydiia bacterium]